MSVRRLSTTIPVNNCAGIKRSPGQIRSNVNLAEIFYRERPEVNHAFFPDCQRTSGKDLKAGIKRFRPEV